MFQMGLGPCIVLICLVCSVSAWSTAVEVLPLERGAGADELLQEALGDGVSSISGECDVQSGNCPEYALVWASGTFMTSFSAAALAHGGLQLKLSLCCNYTFKSDLVRSSAGASRFDNFVRRLVRNLPAPIRLISGKIFKLQGATLSTDLRALQLVTLPIPEPEARLAVQSMMTHAAHFGNTPQTENEDGDEHEEAYSRHWNLLVANFVLECKCPHTLRVMPLLHGRYDTAPGGLELIGGGVSCWETGHGAPRSFSVKLPMGTLMPHARITWTVTTSTGVGDLWTFQHAAGVRLQGVPEGDVYNVSVTVAYGESATVLRTSVGWAYQPHLKFDPSIWLINETHSRTEIVTLSDRLQLPFSSMFGDLVCNASFCPDAASVMTLLGQRLRCNVQHRIVNASLLEVAPLTQGVVVRCSLSDPLKICALSGAHVRIHVVAPRLWLSGAGNERVVCSENATLKGRVDGLPHMLADTAAEYIDEVWSCHTPSQNMTTLFESDQNTIVVQVPDSGLICEYAIKPKAPLVENYLLPWDRSAHLGAVETLKLSSSLARFSDASMEPIHITTKTKDRSIVAPTGAGQWVFAKDSAQFLSVEDPQSSTTTLHARVSTALNASVTWINSEPPCVGHESVIPIFVELAPPVSTDLCHYLWYEDACRQVAAKYPEPDEQGIFFIDNASGQVPSNVTLHHVGVNSVLVCNASHGSKVSLSWRVWNDAGNITMTCILHRCSKIPTPVMAPRMAQTVVSGSILRVEALSNYDTRKFIGLWSANASSVRFDDPHAASTTARGLPPGKTTIRFTLDAIGEEDRPSHMCPTQTVLTHITSESVSCPTAPLRTCSDTIDVPYFSMAPTGERSRQSHSLVNPSDFIVACDANGVTAFVDEQSGQLSVRGLSEGANVSCTVTLQNSEYAEHHCALLVERVRRSPPPVIVMEPFWVGEGSNVPATAKIRVADHREPGPIHWTVATRRLSEVKPDVTTTLTTMPLRQHENASSPLPDGWYEAASTIGVNIPGDSKVHIVAEYIDELCGASSSTHEVHSVSARVAQTNITTCDHIAQLEGRPLPPANRMSDFVRSEWSVVQHEYYEPMLQWRPLPWLAPTPLLTDPYATFTNITFLSWGTYVAQFTLYMVHLPHVRDAVNVTIHALSRNIPPHAGVVFTTQSKIPIMISPHASNVGIVSAPGFRPPQPPTAVKGDQPGKKLLARLYRGEYRINYHPRPVVGQEVDVCPRSRSRMSIHTAALHRVALRVVAGWDRSVSECDTIRGDASLTLRLMITFPNGTFTFAPSGIGFARTDLKAVLGAHNAALWWLSKDVEWTVSTLNETLNETVDHLRGMHLVEREPRSLQMFFGNHTTATQVIRINIRALRFFTAGELAVPSFQSLRFPASAIDGLAESADPELRDQVFVRVVQLNGTSIYVLRGNASLVQRFSDEQVVTGRFVVTLQMQKHIVAVMGVNSTTPIDVVEPITGFIHPQSALCVNRSVAHWIVGFPQVLRDVRSSSCEVDPNTATIDIYTRANDTFVLRESHESRLIVPKAALCGLHMDDPSGRRAAPSYTENDVVDFGRLIVTKTPLAIEQTRDSVLQCILTDAVPYVVASIHGAYVVDAWYLPQSTAPALRAKTPWYPLSVRRIDGYSNLADVNRGPSSVAACLSEMHPTISFVDRRKFKFHIDPCRNLQLPPRQQDVLPRVNLTFFIDDALNDGLALHPLHVRFDIVGSYARLTPMLRHPETGVLEPIADQVAEFDLKSGRVVFEVAIDGDVWHPAVGLSEHSSHDALVARGFGSEDDDDDSSPLDGRRSRQWPARNSEAHGFLQYVDEFVTPFDVFRITDTVVQIVVPSCAERPAMCRRIGFSSGDTPVHYFVPGISTTCPGCIQAVPPVVIQPILGPVAVEVLREGYGWVRLQSGETIPSLPLQLRLISQANSSWSLLAASNVVVHVLTVNNVEIATYTPSGDPPSEWILPFSLVLMNDTSNQRPLRELVVFRAVLQPVAWNISDIRRAMIAGPYTHEIHLALAPPLPSELLSLRLLLAAAHGYLAFFTVETIIAAFTRRSFFAPTHYIARSSGMAVFGLMLLAPARSVISLAVFCVAWGGVLCIRRITWLSAELFVIHLALVGMAP